MKTSDFYQLMENPSLLSADTLPELKRIVDTFPYFPAARSLYLKNLAVLDDVCFGQELKRAVIYLPDRKKLFTLIEGERYRLSLLPARTIRPEEGGNDSFSRIDTFLAAYSGGKGTEANVLFQPSVLSDYIYWIEKGKKEKAEEGSEKKDTDEANGGGQPAAELKHHDLIDSFIQSKAERTGNIGLNPDVKTKPSFRPPEEDSQEEFFTETLANIYLQQERYEKALQIFHTLRLKYPEKSTYFAARIQSLEELIINNNTKK